MKCVSPMFLPLSTGGRVTIICIEIKEAPPRYSGKWGEGEREGDKVPASRNQLCGWRKSQAHNNDDKIPDGIRGTSELYNSVTAGRK